MRSQRPSPDSPRRCAPLSSRSSLLRPPSLLSPPPAPPSPPRPRPRRAGQGRGHAAPPRRGLRRAAPGPRRPAAASAALRSSGLQVNSLPSTRRLVSAPLWICLVAEERLVYIERFK
ncbi:hypothetical protein GQ55_5G450500 [Panicum hallii var. hallii]|uniref:Uncharacterized protein n=1 Tax=Panicum hallii var. hallii TaxID=1504633 RepID=A0A2T7DQ47_9POAL|nr:hypothetical protein GQ55_5G450500 [Panicum hallii var. hallii]